MKTPHSPGKWMKAHCSTNKRLFTIFSNRKVILTTVDHLDRFNNSVTSIEEAEANATLVEIAPELLEACKEALRMYNEIEPAGGWQGVKDQLESLINKTL